MKKWHSVNYTDATDCIEYLQELANNNVSPDCIKMDNGVIYYYHTEELF